MLPTKEDLRKRYATFSDERLLEIVYNKDQYTADALEVAEAEVALRKITDVQVKYFVAEKKQNEETHIRNLEIAAKIPLVLWEKLFFFFLWFAPFFLGRALRANYQEDGMVLKLWQSKIYSILGFSNTIGSFSIPYFFNMVDEVGLLIYALLSIAFLLLEDKLTRFFLDKA